MGATKIWELKVIPYSYLISHQYLPHKDKMSTLIDSFLPQPTPLPNRPLADVTVISNTRITILNHVPIQIHLLQVSPGKISDQYICSEFKLVS